MSFRILLPDGSEKIFDQQPTALEVAQSIGARLAQDTLGVKINGVSEISDFRLPLQDGSRIQLITTKSPEANEVIRHSAAHVMAQAVQALWPDVKVTIGPVIENGFYYDFDSPRPFLDEDFERIEKKVAEIVKADLPLLREEWDSQRAIETFDRMGERFKVEIIRDLKESKVSIYRQGDWFDLCRGPHVQRTGQIKAFKILSVAGAYWRGNEKNPMLQRLYATAFRDPKELEQYLYQIEEAKKRDHRKLGRELNLIQFNALAPGSPFFTPKGTVIYTQLQTFLREMYHQRGYHEVITPQIFDVDLFKNSGHWDHYRDNMYFIRADERDFATKPMNCPSHCLMFAADKHSYRELPIRYADFGRLHRHERAGAMHGLTRVRSFCQDDGHIFCSISQLQGEIANFLGLLDDIYKVLGMFEYKIFFSTRPESRIGSDEVWDSAENALSETLKHLQLPYQLNPGDGAFYGPKLDIMFVDALKRPWQLGTLQLDFNFPKVFDLKYTGDDNQEHQPVMLHRAILGSLERFIGVYLEHTAGHLPPWLSPVQVAILNVTDRVNAYCEGLHSRLHGLGYRVFFDRRSEKLNFKIREAQVQKIPYMLIIGDKEMESQQVSLRLSDGRVVNAMAVAEFERILQEDVSLRRLQPGGGLGEATQSTKGGSH